MSIRQWLHRLVWQYGTCSDRRARRHRMSGEVQFVLWKAGEQGHAVDFWYPFGSGHAVGFKPEDGAGAGMGEG